MIKLKINLNLTPGRIPQRIKVNQFDHDKNALEFSLFNGASTFVIPSGASVTIQGTKPDHKGFQYAAKFSGNTVTADLTEQMTAVSGDVTTELVIEDSNKNKIATANFVLVIEPAALGEDVIVSESELPLLEKVANNAELIESYKNDAQIAQAAAETAAQTAESEKTAAKNAQDAAEAAQAAAESAKADAETAESNAQRHSNNASASALAAGTSEHNAQNYADQSQSYAVGTNGTVRPADTTDNAKAYYEQAKYYYEQAKSISETLSGILQPKGTITFAQLPGLLDAEDGWMYNISDAFTTDSRFKEGAGVSVAAGSNVYKTVDNQWDILAGSPVTRVNGKTGDVTLDKSDVGLSAVPNVTTNDQTPTFAEASTRSNIASGETIATLFGKVKKWFSDLKVVAFSGSYTDLSNRPSIPSKTSDLTNDSGFITSDNTKLPLSGGEMTGNIITPANDDVGIIPKTNNYGQIGSSSKKFYRMYATTFYGNLSGNAATATKATQDESGNNIKASYASDMSLSGSSLSLLNKNGGTLKTLTMPTTDNTKLPLAGGTISGNLTVNQKVFLPGGAVIKQSTNTFCESNDKTTAIYSADTTHDVNKLVDFACDEYQGIYFNRFVGVRTTLLAIKGLNTYGTCSAKQFNTNSDKRIKKNIESIEYNDSINLIDNLNPVSYNFIDEDDEVTKKHGFIAQEAEKVLDDYNIDSDFVVRPKNDEELYSLNYNALIPDIVKYIQILEQRISILEGQQNE